MFLEYCDYQLNNPWELHKVNMCINNLLPGLHHYCEKLLKNFRY
jgi:hypothetical protein